MIGGRTGVGVKLLLSLLGPPLGLMQAVSRVFSEPQRRRRLAFQHVGGANFESAVGPVAIMLLHDML